MKVNRTSLDINDLIAPALLGLARSWASAINLDAELDEGMGDAARGFVLLAERAANTAIAEARAVRP